MGTSPTSCFLLPTSCLLVPDERLGRPGQAAARRRLPHHLPLDQRGNLEILGRDPPGAVGREGDPDAGPRDGEVGVVVRRLTDEGDRVRHQHRPAPPIGLVGPSNRSIPELPSRQRGEPPEDFLLREGCFFPWHLFTPCSRFATRYSLVSKAYPEIPRGHDDPTVHQI